MYISKKVENEFIEKSCSFAKEMKFMRMIISTAFAPCNRRYVESVLDNTIHVHRYNKVDVPEQRKGLVAAEEGCVCCRSGNGVWDAREVANAVLCIPNAYPPILMHRMHGQLIYGRNKPLAFAINRKSP